MHAFEDDGFDQVDFTLMHVEDEFIMDLKDHPGLQLLPLHLVEDPDHGDLDHVGGGSLNRGVDGIAFGKAADGGVARGDVAQVTAALHHGFNIAVAAGRFDGAVHVSLDIRVFHEILVNDFGGLLARNAQPFGQSEGGNSIDDPEIDHLGIAAHLFGYLSEGYAIHFCRGGRVDVEPLVEISDHPGIAAQVGDDAQLDLRVVGRKQHMVVVPRDKGLPDLATLLGADGDVLEVRIV